MLDTKYDITEKENSVLLYLASIIENESIFYHKY